MAKHVFDGSNPALLAPKVLYSAFRSEYRVLAVRGFAHMYLDGGWDLSEELVNTTLKYIKGQRKRLCAAALEDPKLLQLMVQEAFIPQADFQDLFDAASEKGDAGLTAMLLDYQNKRLKPVDVEKEFEKQMTILETNVLPVGDAKKIWRCEKKAGGTLRLPGWKGKDTHVMVPSRIGKDTVTEIGPLAFSPLVSPLTQAARDLRRSIESVGIPAEIETIAPTPCCCASA